MHHPELRKREVREALALAIDCPTLMEQIFDGLTTCHTNLSPTGTVGITAENSAPYPHDPQRARELLAEANYNEDNDIRLSIRSNRVPKEVEYAEAVVTFWPGCWHQRGAERGRILSPFRFATVQLRQPADQGRL